MSVTDPLQFEAINVGPGFTPTDFSVTGDAGGFVYLSFTVVPEPCLLLAVVFLGLPAWRHCAD